MLEGRPQDMQSRVGDRITYDEAARLAETATFDQGRGRDFAAGIGGDADAIERGVVRRLNPRIHPELVERAVRDAIEGRKPR